MIAASLKFHGAKDSRGWQPVAGSAPQQSHPGLSDQIDQWILIGYVRPSAHFDAKLKLCNTQSRLGATAVGDLLAAEARPFHSLHLKISAAAERFGSCPSGVENNRAIRLALDAFWKVRPRFWPLSNLEFLYCAWPTPFSR